MTAAGSYLVVGPSTWRFAETADPSAPFLAIELGTVASDDNTLLLSFRDLSGARYLVVSLDGATLEQGVLEGHPFGRLLPAGTVAALAARLAPAGVTWAPLMVASVATGHLTIHAQIRIGDDEALLLRAGAVGLSATRDDASALADGMAGALRLIHRDRLFLNNHDCCYRKQFPELEIEYKLTLDGPIDLYGTSVALRNLVGTNEMPDYRWQYRDDFQQWDFDNVLFEVEGPAEEAGYISFIPDSTGTVTVKRKWFLADSVSRRESRWRGQALDRKNLARHITEFFGVEFTYRGSFRRRRFDITCESVVSGNVHSIMLDRCTPYDPTGPDLYQAEVEYLTSRSSDADSADVVHEELRYLTDVTRQTLRGRGITFHEGQLSKLSYLRNLQEAERA
jgi:hypothetical protein